MPTYKTKDGSDRIIPGVGRTTNGQITTNYLIESPIFEIVSDAPAPAPTPAPAAPTVAQPAPTIEQTTNKETI